MWQCCHNHETRNVTVTSEPVVPEWEAVITDFICWSRAQNTTFLRLSLPQCFDYKPLLELRIKCLQYVAGQLFGQA